MHGKMNKQKEQPAYATIFNHLYPWQFVGDVPWLFPITIINQLTTILTLGIFSFWARSNNRKYIWKNIDFMGQRFSYHGTGKGELIVNALPVVLFALVIALPFIIKIYYESIFGLAFLGSISTSFFLSSLFFYNAKKYLLENTKWGQHRLSFDLKITRFITHWFFGFFLSVISLGIYLPFWRNKMFAIYIDSIRISNLKIHYTGRGKDVFWEYYWSIPFAFATCGLYIPWLFARIDRYRCVNTWIGGDDIGSARGLLAINGSDYLMLFAFNIICFIASFGLALPWISVQNLHYRLNRLAFVGNLNLVQLFENEQVYEEQLEEKKETV